MFAVLQLVQLAVTVGPSRLPQTSELPDDEEALVLDVDDDDEDEEEVAVPPPHTLVRGTHSSTCWPSADVSMVHARLDEHAWFEH